MGFDKNASSPDPFEDQRWNCGYIKELYKAYCCMGAGNNEEWTVPVVINCTKWIWSEALDCQ